MRPVQSVFKPLLAVLLISGLLMPLTAGAASFTGKVTTAGDPIAGAMVTFRFGSPFQERTVFTADDGSYQVQGLPADTPYTTRVRRIGWQDLRSQHQSGAEADHTSLDFALQRHTNATDVAAQLPANHWYALLLEEIEDERLHEQMLRQCTYCHQQGSSHTRVMRDKQEWEKVFSLMARMGGTIDVELREQLPEIYNRAYDPKTAVPRLTQGWQEPGFMPPPSAEVRRSIIDEYELGSRSSMQHDMMMHPNGSAYSVDMANDVLYRLDPSVMGGKRTAYPIPKGSVPMGGEKASGAPASNSSAALGPHSLQTTANGDIWITMALGNKLTRFDIETQQFTNFDLPSGIYPHTLRVDDQQRVWYTLSVSNQVGVYDTKTGENTTIRVPARSFGEAILLRLLPYILAWDLIPDGSEGGGGDSLPVPYGIDVAPDGGIWFSQLNADRIGHIDPETHAVTMIDTPFSAPRRMRFDSKGILWIPGFSSNVIATFDIDSGEFHEIELPEELLAAETPYTLSISPATDDVWICGANSDSLIRYSQQTKAFTIFPLPTQVTYTRDIDFDAVGNVWTSNSNAPAWQIETGIPRLIRLDVNSPMPAQGAPQ
jgi:virginiamycin B lyase